MLSSGSKVAWLKGYGIVAGLLLVLLGSYYIWFIPNKKANISSRNFRVLADLSDHIKSEILLLPSVISNSAASVSNSLATVQSKSPAPLKSETNKAISVALAAINKSIRNLTLQTGSGTATNPQVLRFMNHVQGDSAVLVFDYDYQTNYSIHAIAPLKRIVDPLAKISDFDDILLLDDSGEVLYQRGGAEFRCTRLELTNAPIGHSFQTNLTIKPTPRWIGGSGADFIMFAQPLQFTVLPDAGDSKSSSCQWLVCGLVSSDHFTSRAMAVGYDWLIGILLIMTFFALAWPFADLWFAPSSLPLRPGHLVIHYLCGLSICALVTLGLLLVAGYHGLEEQLDGQMKKVATNMLSHFQAELEAIEAQTRRFDTRYIKKGPIDETNILSNPELCPASAPGQSNAVATYPAFKMIVWINTNGMQANKWTTTSRNTEKIDVSPRDYFSNIIARKFWTKGINSKPWRFFIDPIYSWNTGENEAVVSQPRQNQPFPVVALDVRFQTFFSPVLPVDFGFCVIDEAGKVLFHSDESRNLHENFVVECNNDPQILRAILGRSPKAIDTQYLNKSYSLFLSPIQDVPWTLVIFRDEQKLQTILLGSSFAVLVLYALSLSILSILVAPLALFTRDRGWLWPDPERHRQYKIVAAVNLLVGVFCLWLLTKSASDQTAVVVTLCVPVCTLLAGWIILRFLKPKSNRPRSGNPAWYCVALGSLIVVGSVVPAAQFFRLIFDEESGLLVRRGQMHIAKQLDNRKRRLQAEYERLGDESELVKRFLTNRLANTDSDCFVTDFFQTTLTNRNIPKVRTPPDKPANTIFEMDSLHPLFDQTVRESSAYASNGDIAGFWHWDYSNAPANTLTLYRDETDEEKEPKTWGIVITSRPWSLQRIHLWCWLGIGLGCLAVASLVAWRLYAGFFRLKPGTLGPRRGFCLVLGGQKLAKPAGYPTIRCEHRYGEIELPNNKAELVWIENFDSDAHDPEATQKKLMLVHRCMSNGFERVVIHSRIHPLNFAFDTQPDSDFAVSQRLEWTQLLLQFRTWFAREVRMLLRAPKASDFKTIWALCSPNEKRVLHQIAQNMLINPKQPEIRALIRSGLVRLSPSPSVRNDSFRKWIQRNVADAELPEFKPLPQDDRFGPIKGPLVFGLVACALVFFLTQRALWDHTVALIPTFLAGLAGMAGFWSSFMQFKGGKTVAADKPASNDSSD